MYPPTQQKNCVYQILSGVKKLHDQGFHLILFNVLIETPRAMVVMFTKMSWQAA